MAIATIKVRRQTKKRGNYMWMTMKVSIPIEKEIDHDQYRSIWKRTESLI